MSRSTVSPTVIPIECSCSAEIHCACGNACVGENHCRCCSLTVSVVKICVDAKPNQSTQHQDDEDDDSHCTGKDSCCESEKACKSSNQKTCEQGKKEKRDSNCCASEEAECHGQEMQEKPNDCCRGEHHIELKDMQDNCCNKEKKCGASSAPCTGDKDKSCSKPKCADKCADKAESSLENVVCGSAGANYAQVRQSAVRFVGLLCFLTVLGCLGEAIPSLFFGSDDGGSQSISLLGFGSDSAVEIMSALIVYMRFFSELHSNDGERNASQAKKDRLGALAISTLLTLLALAIIGTSIADLALSGHTTASLSGLVVGAISWMYFALLFVTKLTVNFVLKNQTLANDIACTRNCMLLSSVLLIGSIIGFTVSSDVSIVDSVTAMVVAVFILYDGVEGIRAAMKKDFAGGCGCEEEVDGGPVGRLLRPYAIQFMPELWRKELLKAPMKDAKSGDCCDDDCSSSS